MSSKKNLDENDNVIMPANEPAAKKIKLLSRNKTESFTINQLKQTVFQYNREQVYELLLQHGVSIFICDTFLNSDVNGQVLSQWIDDMTTYLILKDKLTSIYEPNHLKLSDNQTRHIFAILSKYKRNPYASKNKIICDCVHGQISVHPLLVRMIDTPQFQRLRYLKQLGPLVYVYPSGTHTRFEHSIGTSHLAGVLIRHLKESQPSLQITTADELCVTIAGLCHDLGHGPFSHMFEEVVDKLQIKEWKHEQATLKLFDKMLAEADNLMEEFESYGLFECDVQLIKDLIYADIFKNPNVDPNLTYSQKLSQLESLKARGLEKSFLFEIISNYRNGIDVDKFDYFDRDCSQCGFTNNFNYKRYILCTRVIKAEDGLNQICVRDKEIGNLYEMFHVREYLTRRAYKHEKASAINLMIIEALVKADKHFKFSTIISTSNLNAFERLNDGIFLELLYTTDPELRESKEILERIGKRQLYKYVGSFVLPNNTTNIHSIEDELTTFLSDSDYKIDRNSMVVEIVRFNYGSKNLNPIENVRCYNKYSPDKAFKIEKNQISRMLLNVFEDIVIRLYSKESDFDHFDKLYKGFHSWCKSKNYSSPIYGLAVSQ